MSTRLLDRVAVVTGGASGLGEATVRTFVREGARVVIADVQDDRGAVLARELGEAALYCRTDVSRESDIQEMVDLAVSEFGRLDVLFNNAGIVGAVGPIDETPAAEYDATMAVLQRAVFLGMKHAARVMKPQRSGCILSTSSIAGVRGGLGPHVYATAKAALIGLTRNVAGELGQYGIRVNCIAPGNFATPMIAGMVMGDPDNVAPMEAAMGAGSPLRGRPPSADDVANAALYLASDEGSYVNGHTLVVDAGLTTGVGLLEPFREHKPMFREAGRRGLDEG